LGLLAGVFSNNVLCLTHIPLPMTIGNNENETALLRGGDSHAQSGSLPN